MSKFKKINIFNLCTALEKLNVAKKRWEYLKVISENEGISVGKVREIIGIPDSSTASQNITELENTGWVDKVKIGTSEKCYISGNSIKYFKSVNKFNNKKDKRFFW